MRIYTLTSELIHRDDILAATRISLNLTLSKSKPVKTLLYSYAYSQFGDEIRLYYFNFIRVIEAILKAMIFSQSK